MSTSPETKVKKKKKTATVSERAESPSHGKKKSKSSKVSEDAHQDDPQLLDPDQLPAETLPDDPGEKLSMRHSTSTVVSRVDSPALSMTQDPSASPSGKTKKKKKKKGDKGEKSEEPQEVLDKEDSPLTSSFKELEEPPVDGEEKGGEEKSARKKSKKSITKGREADEPIEDGEEKGGEEKGPRKKSKKSISKGREADELIEDGEEKGPRKKSKKSISKGREADELIEDGEEKSGREKSERRKSKKSIAKDKDPSEDGDEKLIRVQSKKSISKIKEQEEVPEEGDDGSVSSFKKGKKKKSRYDTDVQEADSVQFEDKTDEAPSTSARVIDNEEAPPEKPRKSRASSLWSQQQAEPESECCRKARENEKRRQYEKDRHQPFVYEQRRFDSSICSGYQETSRARPSYGSSLTPPTRRMDQPTYSAAARAPPVSDRREFWRGNAPCPDKPDDEIMRRICMSACGQDRSTPPLYRPDASYRHSTYLNQREYGPEIAERQSSRQSPRTQVVQRWQNDDPGWNQQIMYRSPELSAQGLSPSYRSPEQSAQGQSPSYRSPEPLARNQPQLYTPPQRTDAYQRWSPSVSGPPSYRPAPPSAITPFNTDSGVGLSQLQSCPTQRAGNCDDVYRNALPSRILVSVAQGRDYRNPHNFYHWKNPKPATSQPVERQLNYSPQSEGQRRQTRSQISASLCSNRPRTFANNSAQPASPPLTMLSPSDELERAQLLDSLKELILSVARDDAPSSYSFASTPERNVNTGLFVSESESCVLAKPKKPNFKPSDIRKERPLIHTFSQISPPFPRKGWYSLTRSEPSSRTSDMFSPIYSECELWPASFSQCPSRDMSVDLSLRNASSRSSSLPHSR